MISIEDAVEAPAEQVSIKIKPVQDLHGYDSSWPAGGGKNMLPDITGARTTYSIFIGQADGTTYPIYLEANTAYSVSVIANSGAIGVQVYIKENGRSNIVFANGASGTYTPTQNMNVQMWVYAEGLTSVSQFQLEKGSTPTAWTPYSNICPITGWTGTKVTRTGKNLCPVYTMRTSHFGIDYTVTTEGIKVHGTATGLSYSWTSGINTYEATWLKVPAGTYTFSVTDMFGTGQLDGYVVFMGFDIDGTAISNYVLHSGNSSITITYTKPVGLYYGIYVKQGLTVDTVVKIQLELGPTATDYEPYQGDTYTIAFPSEAGTVYGGTLDVTNGVLTVDRAMVTLTEDAGYSISTSDANRNRIAWGGYDSVGKQNGTFVSDTLATAPNGTGGVSTGDWQVFGSTVASRCWITVPKTIASVNDFKAYVQQHPIQICYELATPVTYTLTPQQIALLRGNNTLWADTGDTTLTYRQDVAKLLEALTQPDESDMVASATYAANSFFTIGGRLYKATAAIATGETIQPGVNCIQTTVADQLTAIFAQL